MLRVKLSVRWVYGRSGRYRLFQCTIALPPQNRPWGPPLGYVTTFWLCISEICFTQLCCFHVHKFNVLRFYSFKKFSVLEFWFDLIFQFTLLFLFAFVILVTVGTDLVQLWAATTFAFDSITGPPKKLVVFMLYTVLWDHLLEDLYLLLPTIHLSCLFVFCFLFTGCWSPASLN